MGNKSGLDKDYIATHAPTKTAITQLLGKRYPDQQDAYQLGYCKGFSALSLLQKKETLQASLIALQNEITKRAPKAVYYAGSTACIVMIDQGCIYTMSVGDSVAFLWQLDKHAGRFRLTLLNKILHQAREPSERSRITEFLNKQNLDPRYMNAILAKMHDEDDPRLGALAVTRALGDNEYEPLGLLHVADKINMHKIDFNRYAKNFLIVASDGLTEGLNSSQIKDYLKRIRHLTAKNISSMLAQTAFLAGSTDNITILAKALHRREKNCYLAVFDGHGTNEIARLAAKLFHKILCDEVSSTLLSS